MAIFWGINIRKTIKLRDLNHLSEIFHSYDTYVIDLWGVMHDGISLNSKAIEVVENLSANSKKIVSYLADSYIKGAKETGFVQKELPIHISNLIFKDSDSGKSGRVKIEKLSDGTSSRVIVESKKGRLK